MNDGDHYRAMHLEGGKFEPGAREISRTLDALATLAESHNLSRDAIQLAIEIASFEPGLADDTRDTIAVLVVAALAALEAGSTRLPVTGAAGRDALIAMLRALGEMPLGNDAPARFARGIEALLESGTAPATIGREDDDYKPLIYRAPFIYIRKIRVAERELAERVASMLAEAPSPSFTETEILNAAADVCARPVATQAGSVILSDEQRAAVEASARARLTVISGGPGTGKTSIVIAILRLMARLGIDARSIALAAPTGKAANRMSECLARALAASTADDETDRVLSEARLEPSTLHRLLGYSPESQRFRHHRNDPLDARVVIVDEGSMLDLTLMERLTGAIGVGARLIILGDADQLPSVAAGAVFRELIPDQSTSNSYRPSAIDRSCVRLVRNFRMSSDDTGGSAILALARCINEGVAEIVGRGPQPHPLMMAARRESAREIQFAGAEFLAFGPPALNDFLDRWHRERVRGGDELEALRQRTFTEGADGFDAAEVEHLRKLFAFSAASRILTVTRVFESGADRINERMHWRTAGDARSFGGIGRMWPGEPVIVIRNDYERMLFNGDNGLVLRVRREQGGAGTLMAVFARRGNFAAYRLDMMRDAFELSYAMTVHKAQGSEFESIALVLPEKKIPLLTREVLYTAVSRARRSVVIVGSESVLADGVAERTARYSGLRELIAGA
jgi:exodeoxyribonuclease V alpha subunit